MLIEFDAKRGKYSIVLSNQGENINVTALLPRAGLVELCHGQKAIGDEATIY